MKTQGHVNISQARTRLHELENHLVKVEADREEAAAFLETYLLNKGID